MTIVPDDDDTIRRIQTTQADYFTWCSYCQAETRHRPLGECFRCGRVDE